MISRRQFLWATATTTGALAVGVSIRPAKMLASRLAPAEVFGAGGWIEIGLDGGIVIQSTLTEMGQGVWRTLAQIVAEELDAQWSQVRVEMAPSWRAYQEPIGFNTGGSTSTRRLYASMRTIAAAARAMLVAAAAAEWGVATEECQAIDSTVIHDRTQRMFSYAQLTIAASKRKPPVQPKLKPKEQWRLLGQSLASPNLIDLVTGRECYGMDLQLPEMLVATVTLAPLPGAVLEHFDRTAALASRGVVRLVDIADGGVAAGVAIVAQTYWQALSAIKKAAPRWKLPDISTADIMSQLRERVQPREKMQSVEPALTRASTQQIAASYDAPLLLHAQLEPLNATVHVHHLGAEVWAPTQVQGALQSDVAKTLGLWPHLVTVRTPRVGGAFGRRLATDYGVVAAQVAREFSVPVKVVWSREEDSLQGRFRPMAAAHLSATLSATGAITQLNAKVASLGSSPRLGVLKQMPYTVDALNVTYAGEESAIRTGPWRSVDASQNLFFRESFIDECALACGRDPLRYRRELLTSNSRAQAVLDALNRLCDWDAARAQGRFLGMAFSDGFESLTALAAEVQLTGGGQWRVKKIFVVIDCGTALNPDGIRAQIEGGVLFGLSAALLESVTYQAGAQREINFDQYRVLHMQDAPDIAIQILETPEAGVGGVGEAGVPPVAPALANALFAAKGARVRSLPFNSELSGR